MGSTGSLPVSLVTSWLSPATTAGSLWTHSGNFLPSFTVPGECISHEYWCPRSLLSRVRLNHSTVPSEPLQFQLHTRLISTLCWVSNCDILPINSLPGSTCRTMGHFKGYFEECCGHLTRVFGCQLFNHLVSACNSKYSRCILRDIWLEASGHGVETADQPGVHHLV